MNQQMKRCFPVFRRNIFIFAFPMKVNIRLSRGHHNISVNLLYRKMNNISTIFKNIMCIFLFYKNKYFFFYQGLSL